MDNNSHFSSCTIRSYESQCFEKLTESELEYLNANTVIIDYKKGENICKKGSFASHIMFVESGLVKVYLENGSNLLVLRVIPEKNLLGLSSLNDKHNTFQYSSMAYVDSKIKLINMEAFKKVLSGNPYFAKEVIDVISSVSVIVNGRFFCLTHKQSYGRLADIILCLSDRVFKSQEFELPLSRKELGELSGMSPETVTRMLNSLKKDGLIEMSGKIFKVIDHDRLEHICETG